MNCKFCGNEIEENAEFCFVCGQKISGEPADQPAQSEAPAAETQAPAAEPIPVAVPADAEDYADVTPAQVQKAGRFVRFISFICPLIGAIIYMVYAKRGQTGKKQSVANATMSGVCLYLIVAILFVVKKSMF